MKAVVAYCLRCDANAARFSVLEFVKGETLAERIQRGPIPVEETLDIVKR